MTKIISSDPLTMEYPLQTFTPLAYYDKHMDCIRVQIRDCSITETRVNDLLTILEDNYPEQGQRKYVGFTFKGVSHIFKQLHLPLEGVLKVTDLFNKIVAVYPELLVWSVAREAIRQVEPTMIDTELQVNFAEAA